jgi:hypothetical protein
VQLHTFYWLVTLCNYIHSIDYCYSMQLHSFYWLLLLCAITYILLINEHNGDVSPENFCQDTPFQFHDCHLSPILILTVQKTEVLYCAVWSSVRSWDPKFHFFLSKVNILKQGRPIHTGILGGCLWHQIHIVLQVHVISQTVVGWTNQIIMLP